MEPPRYIVVVQKGEEMFQATLDTPEGPATTFRDKGLATAFAKNLSQKEGVDKVIVLEQRVAFEFNGVGDKKVIEKEEEDL